MLEKRTKLLVAAILFLALATPGDAGKGKISLVATFRDRLADPVAGLPPDRITSDLKGVYVDGTDNVDVSINPEGHFDFRLFRESSPGPRALTLDFSTKGPADGGNCASPGSCNPPFEGARLVVNTILSTRCCGDTRLGSLEPGAAGIGDYRLRLHFPDPNQSGQVWFLTFKSFDAEHPCSGSSGVGASHPDANTWEIEGPPTAIGCLELTTNRPKAPRHFKGLYYMPFKIGLARK